MTNHRANDAIEFVLNGERHVVRDLAPTTTLLTYLRNHRRLTGTKEGCAEGDCGACTVALGRIENGELVYRPANACIAFLPMLHGTAIRTVEGIAGPDGELHPCQSAIVEHHGSQCGFCTPGFVANLYCLSDSGAPATHDAITDALAGNLCRCTGYGPLIEAAAETMTSAIPAWDVARRAADGAAIAAIDADATVAVTAKAGRAWRPASLDEFADLYEGNPDARIVAGATDVGLWVTKQLRDLPEIIAIGAIPELRTIRVEQDRLVIGAAVTYADLLPHIAEPFPALAELVGRIGGAQVRALGTIGGNIANGSPIGDMPPALIALDATLVLRKGSSRRRVAIENFFIAYGKQDRAPGEFVEAIEIPWLAEHSQLTCIKISKRRDQDISAVCGCFNITIISGRVHMARLAYGGMAGIPKRATHAEACLVGEPWTAETIARAAAALGADFTPLSDMRGSAGYRLATARNLLYRTFAESRLGPRRTRIDAREGTTP